MGFESINQSFQSSEFESILHFWLEKGSGGGLSLSTSPANHHKFNVIQKQAFHFFSWRGVADRVQVHSLAQLIIRTKMSH